MDVYGVVLFLVVGLLAGWIAGLITKGEGFGLLTNMLLGVVGAFVGGYLFFMMDIVATGIIGLLVAAIVGAVVLLVILGLVRKAVK